MHWVYYFGRVLIRVMVFPLASWHVQGTENITGKGPYLIVCNHLHIADPPIVAASIKLKAVFMAKEELFQGRWTRFWVSNFGAFPVRRGGLDREVFAHSERWLKQGISVIMFPEGKRSKSAQLQPAFPGSALIASRLGVPILPVSITGTDKFRRFKDLLRRPVVMVTIGKAFYPPETGRKPSRSDLDKLTDSIMEHIAGLLPRQYRGVYDRERPPEN